MEASTNEDAVLLSTDQPRASTLCQLHVIPHDDSVGQKNNFIQTDILLDEYKNFSEILKIMWIMCVIRWCKICSSGVGRYEWYGPGSALWRPMSSNYYSLKSLGSNDTRERETRLCFSSTFSPHFSNILRIVSSGLQDHLKEKFEWLHLSFKRFADEKMYMYVHSRE